MAREKPLNSNQRAVLEWISHGCPEGVLPDYAHRIVAKGLETRGLVTVSGRGPVWAASITSVGVLRLATELMVPDYAVEASKLWQRVLATGDHIRFDAADDLLYRRILQSAKHSPERPLGKSLEIALIRGDGARYYVVRVVDFIPEHLELQAVPVPKSLKDCHPAVDAYLKDRNWHCVSKDLVTRAALIFQALATEGERRGFTVKRGVKNRLLIETSDDSYEIRILEVPGANGAEKSRYPYEQPANMPTWEAIKPSEFIPTGRLEVRVHGPRVKYSGDAYRDAKAKRVEDRLPELFRSFEVYAIEAERERRKRAEEERLRHIEWEGAMLKARAAYKEHARWEALKQQLVEWKRVRELRSYLEEMKIVIDAMQPGADQEQAFEWYHWARARTADADPLVNRIEMPRLVNPGDKDLEPFLGGRSPYFERSSRR